jgi:hypothetical protein
LATKETTAGVLSAEDRERFERDGYLVFDPEIPTAVLDGVLAETEAKYRYQQEELIDDQLGIVYAAGGSRIIDLWKVSDNVKQLALAPKVLAVCEELYGRKPLPFQTLNFPVGTQQLPHQDSMHFNSDPSGYMCGVWIALEDMDMDNGPLIYFPGSQKLPVPNWEEIGRPPDEDDYPNYSDPRAWIWGRYQKYEEYVQGLLEQHGFEPEYGTISKGQALLWSANLIHGGSPQRDKSRTRHSQVTHYYFEGCRYYTPMRGEGKRQFWRYPWWVRDEDVGDAVSMIRDTVGRHVPQDAKVVVLDDARRELDLEGRESEFLAVVDDVADPSPSEEGRTAVKDLEQLRQEGAEFLIVPRYQLGRLMESCNDLQQHLEASYPVLVRDGGSCAIYDLQRS